MRTEPLIFESGARGRRGSILPKSDVPARPLGDLLPDGQARKDTPALPEVSEQEVVRHFTRLSQLNFSADTNFYPLGSCTMKYNPKMNETASSLPGFTGLHPYQDPSSVQGMLELLWDLERILCELTGMDAFTLHPAAGAQGELTGLLIARAYFESKKEPRTLVIVPDSAHGTNPASAALAGYSVVPAPSNRRGRIDVDALKNILSRETAMVMVTCPNTLGLFEDEIEEVSRLAHAAGALLYMDGANFNALAGLAQPARLGFDVMHLNLHKTFSVPHGGGGPGAGPVGVTKALAPYLPFPRVREKGGKFTVDFESDGSIGRLRAFFGNTLALVRAYAYVITLGRNGLREMSENAILNANYLLARLKDLFPPFIDESCMHECVLTPPAGSGLRTLDIAKRLLDYGFYAPTVYFPLIVPEAMMVEPTETESKKTMDDFADAMRAIAEEARKDPGLLRSAPHTLPVRRLDEVTAARNPVLRWRPAVRPAPEPARK